MRNLIRFENAVSLALLVFPALLWAVNGFKMEDSLSDFLYTPSGSLFVSYLTIAGMTFIYNGTRVGERKYNAWLGVLLIITALFGYKETETLGILNPIIHFTAAGGFFLGNAFVTIKHTEKSQLTVAILISSIIVIPFVLYYGFDLISLLYAEWIAVGSIVFNFRGENTGKLK